MSKHRNRVVQLDAIIRSYEGDLGELRRERERLVAEDPAADPRLAPLVEKAAKGDPDARFMLHMRKLKADAAENIDVNGNRIA